jgi:hypothetical protein
LNDISHFLSWTYKSEDELGGTSFKGEMATYSGGGYTQNLHQSLNVTTAILAELKDQRWIDQVAILLKNPYKSMFYLYQEKRPNKQKWL